MKRLLANLFVTLRFLFLLLTLIAPVKQYAQITIQYGDNIQDAISVPNEIDVYRFTGNAADKLTLLVTKTSGQGNPQVEIYDPNGLLFKSAVNNFIRIDTQLQKTGVYTIRVSNNPANATNSYALSLQSIKPVIGTSINYGVNLQRNIGAASEIDAYTFNASANDRLTILVTKTSGEGNPRVEFYDPDGLLVKNVVSNIARIDTQLQKTGVYTIWVLNNPANATNNYALSLQPIKPIMGTTISYGTNLQRSISAAAEIDAYIFSGNNMDVISLLVTKTSGEGNPRVEIYDPDGLLVKSAVNNFIRIDSQLQKAGVYTIWVLDNLGVSSNNYALSLNCLVCSPTPVTWIYFKGLQQANDIHLSWATASEENSKEFKVERSTDGILFTEVGSRVASGYSNQTSSYHYIDNSNVSLKSNVLYYRLKQIDVDGQYKYSKVISVPIQQLSQELIVIPYPNPFKETITLQIFNATTSSETDRVELYALDGRLLYQRGLFDRRGNNVFLDNLPPLSKSTYLLKTVINKKTFTNTVIR